MGWRVGIDSGGTFTDVCLLHEETGRVEIWKVSSTPADPSDGIVNGIGQGMARVGGTGADISYFGHGTTVSTNALIQGRGVRTGLITTSGFRDLLEIGRQKRPDLYDVQVDKPTIIVPRDLRCEVEGRLRHDGSVDTELDEAGLRNAVKALKAAGVEAVAVCFLYSFVDSVHEQSAERILAEEFPEAFISISHRVAPEFREFERLSTSVINAYLGPVVQRYVRRLEKRLVEAGLRSRPHLTQSNGGIISFETAANFPVRTILSGPSTGVVAAQAIGRQAGLDKLITFDMGGTSSDVALLHDGQCRMVSEAMVHGYPIKSPMLDIHTVGAGGGSIAYVDSGGHLKVGPRSAGADPGPVCYGLGNEEPTVTDANVVLQALNPTHLLAGRMPIRRDLSLAAIQRIADRLGLDLFDTANGILEIVTANMAKAIRVISVQRGYDPRDYALLAFGGAGPVHAARLARELDMKTVIVPPSPGVLCAMGLLMTDLRTDFSLTRLHAIDALGADELGGIFAQLDAQAEAWFRGEELAPEDGRVMRSVDARYLGQNYEITVPVPAGAITASTLAEIRRAFEEQHHQLYGFIDKAAQVQLVTYRLAAMGGGGVPERPAMLLGAADADGAIIGARDVWMQEIRAFTPSPIYERAQLRPGNVIAGPAIIEQMDTTTVVPPGVTASVDGHLNIVMVLK